MINNLENKIQMKNSNIEIRNSISSDLIDFEPRYDEDKYYIGELRLYIENFPTTSLLIDNKIIAIGGFVRSHKGVWSSWNIVSKEYVNYKKNTFKYIVTSFYKLKEQVKSIEDVHRFQALVRIDRKEAIKFNLLLGYKKEAVLKQYDIYKRDILVMSELMKGDQ